MANVPFNPNINKDDLLQSCLEQAPMRAEWGRKKADAIRDKTLAERKLKLVAAEIKKKMRSDPAAYDLGRATKDAVDEAVILTEEYQKAEDVVIAATHRADMMEAAVWAIEQRKKMVEVAVRLWEGDYFGSVNVTNSPRMAETDKGNVRRRSVRETAAEPPEPAPPEPEEQP